jgi:tetratricopeptide (TPR) repeat protein
MMNNFKHSASIERYLSSEMPAAEKENFEREITLNEELYTELKLSMSIDESLKREDIVEFRKKLAFVMKEHKKQENEIPVVRLHPGRFWSAAASLIILAVLGSTLYFSHSGGNTTESLFKQYYNSENLIDVTRSGDANIVEAVIKFQEKDYQLAARLFKQILEKDNNNIACWFYFGIASIETENYKQAEKAFNHIISDNQNLYVEHAEWYLGLSFLKSAQPEKAKSQFEKISKETDNFHRQDAIHLLEKMNK